MTTWIICKYVQAQITLIRQAEVGVVNKHGQFIDGVQFKLGSYPDYYRWLGATTTQIDIHNRGSHASEYSSNNNTVVTC